MSAHLTDAPGWPGIEPRWTSSAKTGVGTALSRDSRVWFTVSHGILNELYYPRIDQACIRDLGLIVTDGRAFFSEEKRHASHDTAWLSEWIPAFRLVNTCARGRYRITKEIVADPVRPAVLQRIRFEPLRGQSGEYHLYALLAPHLSNHGADNTAWLGEHDGVPLLFAERDGRALALACSTGWIRRSVGFVGVSDGWQDLSAHKRMTWAFERAAHGNVAMTGELALPDADAGCVLVLGFGAEAAEAARCVADSLRDGFDAARDRYVEQWREWHRSLRPSRPDADRERDLTAVSTATMRTCESKAHPGGIVASLSIPWGFAKGDGDLGGYHLIWPRDLVETAGALLAVGATEDVRRVLSFLEDTQTDDGHWPQNMWIDGAPYWKGVQLDETAFPILLVDLAARERALSSEEARRLWPMVRRAASYLVTHGPVATQDRWEEDPGYSPFTLAVTIAALVVAADAADRHDDGSLAAYLRETADRWNECIERWTYVTGTPLARQIGVDGYYVRIAPPDEADASSPAGGFVPIKNRPPGESREPAGQIVSPDALALVRFGLRAADDPRIVNTVRVIDALLKVELPHGPAWHRYNHDGYGEHADGAPFDGLGIGRVWPLLTGERGHYELAAGRGDQARRLLDTMARCAGDGGLIPEQVWDAPDIPALELRFGRPSGSAMPLVWAHAEYVKLRRSIEDGLVFDLPARSASRYLYGSRPSPFTTWRFNHTCGTLQPGRIFRVETLAPAIVHWTIDDWNVAHDTPTRDTGTGIHVADLQTRSAPAGANVRFTFFWPQANRWEGRDFQMAVS
jgi:glucoamylase